MNQQRIPAGDAAALRLQKVAGDLNVKSGQEPEILVESNADCPFAVEENEVTLRCNDDCTLTLPAHLDLRFDRIAGDVRITNVPAAVEGNKIDGDLYLIQTGPAAIGSVAGDVSAAGCSGDLSIRAVGGDLRVESLAGNLSAGVGGDLHVSAATGGVTAHTGGNAKLHYVAVNPGAHAVQAGGNISCNLPDGSDASLNLQYGGSLRIGSRHARQPGSGHVSRLVLGNGETAMNLLAGGNIHINSDAEDGELAELTSELQRNVRDIAGSVDAQLGAMASQIDAQLGERGYGDAIAARVHEKMQKAMAKAEAKIERAMRQAERQAARADRRAAKSRVNVREAQATSQRSQPPISDEERAAVLRMLEEGKISVDQAERLLSAMEA